MLIFDYLLDTKEDSRGTHNPRRGQIVLGPDVPNHKEGTGNSRTKCPGGLVVLGLDVRGTSCPGDK